MAIKIIKEPRLVWVNIDSVDEESLKYLKENYSFHPLDLEDLHTEQQTPKIDAYKNYAFAVLQFPTWQATTKTVVSFELNLFVGQGYVITIQRQKSKEMKHLFYRCLNNRHTRAEWMSSTSGYLLYNIIEELFRDGHPLLNHLGKDISTVEEKIFAGKQDSAIIRELAVYRRNVLNLRRIIEPQRYIIGSLSGAQRKFLGDADQEAVNVYFDNIQDYIDSMWAVIGSYHETLKGLHLTVESLITRRTNKTISILTLISVIFLPPTLFTSVYGMNIPLPFQNHPITVWVMFIGSTLITILLTGMVKKIR